MKALISDKRITTKINNKQIIPSLESYLIPGCGFGGSCFPKDVQALLDYANKNDINTPLLKAVLDINSERPNKMILLAESILNSLENKKISILGLTFKPETDDLRSSPALDAIKILLQESGSSVEIGVLRPKTFDQTLSKSSYSHHRNHSKAIIFHYTVYWFFKMLARCRAHRISKWRSPDSIRGSLRVALRPHQSGR